MADNTLLFKPKYRDIKNASKIFFACHPSDFKVYFEDISDKILEKASDNNISAVFSYINPDLKVSFDEIKEYLKKMQLLVIPVTWDLLLKPNMVIDSLLPYALEKHIPILPLMQDPALTSEYPKHFGNIQFLCDDKNDKTAIPYDIKLNDFIKDTLVGDELRRRVQAAFDAYIFLSYRKKDRKIAQEIMHLIHQNKFCRDIAIWYDEFLTPGEDFNKSIQKAIEKSDLFAMVITPNIVEPNNYIIKHEYPAADTAKKTILPLEGIKTDKDELNKYYKNIPSCTDAHDSTALSSALLRNLKIAATEENGDLPEHNYLIGLAYLTGIDVEVNHERGIELIKKAAEADMPEAVARMATIYKTGLGCNINYNQYEYWTDRLIEIYKKLYPEYDADGWLRLTNSLFGKMLLHHSTNNILAAKSAAEETIFYASKVKKEKDIYYVTYVLSMANLTLSGIEQQLIANSADSETNELVLLNDTFKAGLKGLHEAERIIEEYIKRHPQDNAAMLEALTYSQLLSSYCALREVKNAKKYYTKLMAVAVRQNERAFIDELNFQWLSFEKSLKIDLNNEKKVKTYCHSLIKFFCEKEINKETALAVLQMGFQLKVFTEALLNCEKLSVKDIFLLEAYIKKCLLAYHTIPKKYITNFILSAFSQVLLFGTSLEEKLNRRLQGYHYWKEYSEITELILARYDNIENKQKLREALHVLAFLSMAIKDYDAGYNYGLRYYNLCFEIVKLLPKDQDAHIECVNAVSFFSHYFATKEDMEKSLKYAKSACEMADSIFKYFDNEKTLLCLAKKNSEYASLLLGAEKHSEALESCEYATSALFELIDITKKNKSAYYLDFRLQVFDALYDSIKLMGDIFFESEDFAKAEKRYSYFLKIVGDDKDKINDVKKVLYRLAMVYIGMEDSKKAEETFKKLIAIDPKNKQAISDYKAFKREFKEYL